MRIAFTILLLALSINSYAEMLVVVSKDSPIDTLSENEVSNIFLGKTNYLKSVGQVVPLELTSHHDKYAFYKRISGKSPAQINSYWTTLIFTGKGKPPKEFRSLVELLRELANNPNAITYMPANQINPKVKVVYTLR